MTKIKVSAPNGVFFIINTKKMVCQYNWNCEGTIIKVSNNTHEYNTITGICDCGDKRK